MNIDVSRIFAEAQILTTEEAASLESPRSRATLRDLCFELMQEAYIETTGDQYHAPTRNLFYEMRRMIQQYTDQELDSGYFSYTLVPEYQRTVRPLPLIYYDPRGELHEPHTGKTVPLGTREIEGYTLPKNLYNKMLYIEKKGFWPPIEDAKLAEKYDMAVVVGQGYAVEAARTLFQRAKSDGDNKPRIFVLHDADDSGYEIARTAREETKRMPGYKVDVEDLGLTVEFAIEAGLPSEYATRQKSLSSKLKLTDIEREWFTGEKIGTKLWRYKRVELNAFTIPDLLAYIETRLADLGATEKVIPSDKVLSAHAKDAVSDDIYNRAHDWLVEYFGIDALAEEFTDDFINRVITNPRQWVLDAQERDPSCNWKAAIKDTASARIDDLEDDIETALRELVENDS